MSARYPPEAVMPPPLGELVRDLPHWFVIGPQAVRCFCPYRPSQDVDFGVTTENELGALLERLSATGRVQIVERAEDTVHLTWNDTKVSVFVLAAIGAHTEEHRLTIDGILATKLHAVIDRGLRRDFFDLYVVLQQERLSIASCLTALREVYRQPINDSLVLRALTYFDDAEKQAPLPGEGPKDWLTVREFFMSKVGEILQPPRHALAIQSQIVDVLVR